RWTVERIHHERKDLQLGDGGGEPGGQVVVCEGPYGGGEPGGQVVVCEGPYGGGEPGGQVVVCEGPFLR
ncbi:hypothetical protein H0E87_027336, partial [Populus deltoides]